MPSWTQLYPKAKRPKLGDLREYFTPEIIPLFDAFSQTLKKEYAMGCRPPIYTTSRGWVFQYGHSSFILLNDITIADGRFVVHGIVVSDEETLALALAFTAQRYHEKKDEYKQTLAEKNQRQKESTQRRLQREKVELAQMEALIDKAVFNQFRWCPKVSRQTLRRLYQSDAKGMLDEQLLDDVGTTLYVRCLQGRDEMLLLDQGKIKCHHCEAILTGARLPVTCTCGYQYLYRDYRRSFRRNNLPSNSATPIFNAFIDKWPKQRTSSEKMRLVDWLIHEFHMNLFSGVKGRFVGINLIEGSKKQIQELILELAYQS